MKYMVVLVGDLGFRKWLWVGLDLEITGMNVYIGDDRVVCVGERESDSSDLVRPNNNHVEMLQ